MRLNSPTLTLSFLGTDLPSGHGGTQIITDCYIVKGSIHKRPQLMKGLRSSSSLLELTLSRDCLITEDIIATDGDIYAVLTDSSNVIFTGYLSTKYSWSVGNHGEVDLACTIEDVGTRLLDKAFIEHGYYTFDTTASAAIAEVCTACGITISSSAPTISQPIFKVVDSKETCKNIIDQILYECNYVYFFDNFGQMNFFEVNVTSTSGATVIDSTNLIVRNGRAVSLSKSVRTYNSSRVTFKPLGEANNYLVYRNTTGQSDSHPYCYIELAPGEHFDGAEIYTAQEWAEAMADSFRLPTLIGAVNADSETVIVGSNPIISISNVVADIDADSAITATIVHGGGPYIKIDCENTGSANAYIRKLDASASIVYEDGTSIVNTGVSDGATDSRLDEEVQYIHERTAVSAHANLLAQFNSYCNSSYSFSTKETLTLGEIIELEDDTYTGLDVFVMVISCVDSDDMDTIDYTAIGVSVFDLSKDAYHQITDRGKANTRGAVGPQGPSGTDVTVEYALGTYLSPIYPPSENMTWGGEVMTWGGDPMMWGADPWSSTIPTPVRGQCIWMRTRVGASDSWHYSRLTGLTAFEPMCLNVATTATPTATPDGQALIYGDYFVAGAEFTENNVTYKEGYAYTYDGNGGWNVLNIGDPNNKEKALQCCNAIISSGNNVQDSTAATWGWFKNLVAQNGVFENLVTRNLQVGDGDGTEGSGFRFRARAYDEYGHKLADPEFDVFYGDNMLFSVDIATGKIFFGSNFWYDPGDSAIHSANDNVIINAGGGITATNALIKGASIFEGSFDCDVIKTETNTTSSTDYATTRNDARQVSAFPTIGSGYVYATIVGVSSNVRYVQITSSASSSGSWANMTFYDESLNMLDIRNILSCSYSGNVNEPYLVTRITRTGTAYGQWATNGFTLRVYDGGNLLKVNIPSKSQASSLSHGMLYYDPSDGTVKMKL